MAIDFELLADTSSKLVSYSSPEPTKVLDLGDSLSVIARTENTWPTIWISPDDVGKRIRSLNAIPDNLLVTNQFQFGQNRAILSVSSAYVFANENLGNAIWVSDGTNAGTQQLISGVALVDVDTIGGLAYLTVKPNKNEPLSIWVTDGTTQGTKRVFEDGGVHSDLHLLSNIAVVGNQAFVVVRDYNFERYLAKLDNSNASPVLVRDFPIGGNADLYSINNQLVIHNLDSYTASSNQLLAYDPVNGAISRLAVSAHLLKPSAIEPFFADELYYKTPSNEVWTTDGTVEGTKRLFNNSWFFQHLERPLISRIGSSYLVAANHLDPGLKYYLTDPTGSNTIKLGITALDYPYFHPIAITDSAFYVIGKNQIEQIHLFRIDAITGAKRSIARINGVPFRVNPDGLNPTPMAFGNRVLFSDNVDGSFILREFDEITETVRSLSTAIGSQGQSISRLASDNNVAWYKAGNQIWWTEGTPEFTGSVEVDQLIEPLTIESPQVVNGDLIFDAIDATLPSNQKRWIIDGVTKSLSALGDLPSRAISKAFKFGDAYFQIHSVNSLSAALYKLDGNFMPSELIKYFPVGGYYASAEVYVQGKRAILEVDGSIWRTDGTASGTIAIPLSSGTERVLYKFQVEESASIVFITNENRLYRIQASTNAATLVGQIPATIYPGFNDKDLFNFYLVAGGVVFSDTKGRLFSSDGTTTKLLLDFGGLDPLTEMTLIGTTGGKVIVSSESPLYGFSLWASDGTLEGTERIHYQSIGSRFNKVYGYRPQTLPDGKLLLTWRSESSGAETMVTDGTAAGTELFADAMPGFANSFASQFTNIGNRIIMAASTDHYGAQELLVADYSEYLASNSALVQRFFVEENRSGISIGKVVATGIPPESIQSFGIVDSADDLDFSIDSTGLLSLATNSAFDFESTSTHLLTVEVRFVESLGQIVTRGLNVEIVVMNNYERIDAIDQVFEIDENSRAFQYVGRIEAANPSGLELRFNRTGGFPFTIDRSTGQIYVLVEDSLLDYEVRKEFIVGATISHAQDNKAITLRIKLRDVEEPPVNSSPLADQNIWANSSVVRSVASTFVDPEGTQVAYRVQLANGSPLPSWVDFDSSTRALRFEPTLAEVGSHTFQIIATDSANQSAFQLFRVQVYNPLKPWNNFMFREDTNGDAKVTPIDALIIIDRLNARSDRILPITNPAFEHFCDVNGDNRLSPIDALLVIQYLNQRKPTGEGEAPFSVPLFAEDNLIDSLSKRRGAQLRGRK